MRWRDMDHAVSSLAEVNWSAPHQWPVLLRLASFLLLALLSFAFAWGLGDSYEAFESATEQAQRLRASNEAAGVAERQLRHLQAKEQALLQRIEEQRQSFLLADELPDLLDLIASLSAQRAVALESLAVGGTLSGQRFDLQPLNLALSGAYHDIGFLCQELAALPWPVVVDGVEVSAKEEDRRVLDLTLALLVPTQA